MDSSIYSEAGKPHRFELRLIFLYVALFMPNAIYLSFFPLWLSYKLFTPVEISTLLTLPVFVRMLITPVFAHFADKSPERARILIAISFASLACASLLLWPFGYLGVMSVVILIAIFWSPQIPISDSIVLSGTRRYGTDYASIRIWGSVMFLVLNVVAGYIIERTNAASAIPLMVLGFGVICVASMTTPRLGKKRVPLDAKKSGSANALVSRPVIFMLISTAFIQSSHGLMYNFGSIYWTSLGMSAQMVGFLWATQVLAEIGLFHFYSRLFGAVRPEVVLYIATLFAVIRWVFFGFGAELNLGVVAFAILQVTHAFTFGATYIAQQNYLSQAIPEEQAASAQGLTVFVHGAAMASVLFASGPLYSAFQSKSFFAMILVSLVGLWFAFRFGQAAKSYPHNSGDGGNKIEPS